MLVKGREPVHSQIAARLSAQVIRGAGNRTNRASPAAQSIAYTNPQNKDGVRVQYL